MIPNRLLIVTVLSFVLSILSTSGATGQTSQQLTQITITENVIYVKVQVNGRGPYNFMLDLGASRMGCIDQRLAKELGLNIVGFQENLNGDQIRREFMVGLHKLSLGRLVQTNLNLRVADCNTVPRPIPVDGIIGPDFFYNYLLTIDGPGRRLSVTQTNLEAQAKGVLRYTNAFRIWGKVGQKELAFNLDTGSNLGLLFPTSSLAGTQYADTPTHQTITRSNITFVLQEAVVKDEIALGGIRLQDQKIYYSDKAHQINVGEGFLKEHSITIDQQRKLIRID